MSQTVEYPDVLGYITGVERFTIGAVQTAVAVRPDVVRAGRPFEVIVLIQNASDAPVDVTVSIQLPDRDGKRQKDRFIAKVNRLVVGVQPAEVGYVAFPVNTLPDTAPSDYKVGLELSAKMLEKGQRVRAAANGLSMNLKQLRPELLRQLEELKTLTFSTEKRGLLKNSIEASFGVLAGKAGTLADLQPGWVSLWTMLDVESDPLLMLRKFHTDLSEQVLPKLSRTRAYKPLYEKTMKKFQAAGYPLTPLEGSFVARLMTLILEYASTADRPYSTVFAEAPPEYMIKPILDDAAFMRRDDPITLPNWIIGLMRAIGQDKRAASQPERAIVHFAYDDLMLDALMRGFELIEAATGEDLGSLDDMDSYSQQVLGKLNGNGKLDFTHAYMPLVMGGIVIYDSMLMPDEKIHDIIDEMVPMLQKRRKDLNEETEPVFMMAKMLLDQALMKFGFQSEL